MDDKDPVNEKRGQYHGSETTVCWKPKNLGSRSDSSLISKFLWVPVTLA